MRQSFAALLCAAMSLAAVSASSIAAHAPATAPGPAHAPDAPADHLGVDVTAEKLLAHIRDLPTKRAAWGDEAHKRGLRETEAVLVQKLREMGHEPVLQPVDHIGSRRGGDGDDGTAARHEPWNNIIVEIPGSTRPEEVLLWGAHFDAVPGSPGADDNGTGVATLLEAARVLKGRTPRRTVRLAFFNLEEVGLVGARAYAASVRERLENHDHPEHEKIVGMVSMDMLGYFSDEPGSQRSPIPESRLFKPPTVADFIAMAGLLRHRHFSQALDKAMRRAEPTLKTVVVDFLPIAPPDLLRSDHAPFLGLGVPAVLVTDTANFRSAHYHKPTDTIETLDVERFTITARAMIGALGELAGVGEGELIELSPPARDAE
jgi:hypothetical protein